MGHTLTALPVFTFERIVNADRDKVCRVFANFKDYSRLVPEYVPSVRIRSVRGNVGIVEQRLILGNDELLIMAKHVTNDPVSHEIFVIGGDVKGSHIREEFIQMNNATRVRVSVNLKFGRKKRLCEMFGRNDPEGDYGKVLDSFVMVAGN